MNLVTKLGSPRSWAAIGFLLFITITFQPALAVTNYVFFSVNGDTSAPSLVQGDRLSWGANCDTGATLTWEIWLDLNSNSVIDTLTDRMIASFDATDGDTSSNGPPPDSNPIPDGWYISPAMVMGVAPGQYIFKARNHTDNSVAQRTIIGSELPSPPNMFRGQVTVAGHPAPDAFLRNIWVEADPQSDRSQIWSGLTNDSGFYQINVGAEGSGLECEVFSADISGYVNPGYQYRIASGIVDSVNFAYLAPTDSLYGFVKDQDGALLTMPISGYCSPRMGGNGKDFQTNNGAYIVYFGPSEYGQWGVGLNPENIIPTYLCPSNFDFDNRVVHSLRHDFVCYATDTVIYARVMEVGGNPTHQYLITAQSINLQGGTYGVSGTGGNNLVTMHISSLDPSNWCVNVANWDNRYPIPPGYILDGIEQTCNRQPGDTISLNFIFGKMVSDTLKLDSGDTPPEWNNMWVNMSNNEKYFGGMADNNGVYTIYADTGTYTLNANQMQYLSDPSSRTIHLTGDTTGGLGFIINEAHCRVTGTLVNVPIPIPGPAYIYAHTGDGNNGYTQWFPVDSTSGTFTTRLCDGNWTIDPPSIPNMISPPPANFTISERPDTDRVVNLVYTFTGVDGHDGTLPGTFSLAQNYPNPFNAQTTIAYGLSKESHVTVEVYDLLGRKIETLQDGDQAAGYYQLVWNAVSCPSGFYFYRLKTDGFKQTQKMLLLK